MLMMRAAACGQVTTRDVLGVGQGDVGNELALADDKAAVLAHAAVGRDITDGAATRSFALRHGPVGAAHALGGERDGFDDLRVAGAAADIAGDRVDDLLARRLRIVGEQRMRGEDHGRRAIAALHAVRFAERVLDRATTRRGRA